MNKVRINELVIHQGIMLKLKLLLELFVACISSKLIINAKVATTQETAKVR